MGDGIFSGLEAFGLSGLEGMNIFEEEKKTSNENNEPEVKKAPVFEEKDFLLDKTMKCTLCDRTFKARCVKGGKAKLIGTDSDFRPRYQELDIAKYDVIMCPFCGYTALTRYFPGLLQIQGKRIREKITPTFKPILTTPETYSYDDAIDRYKMALVNAIVKEAKPSEKAYICLKSSWMYRGKAEEIGEAHPDYQKIKAMEQEFTKNAYEGFVQAISKESFPMAGMDEMTVNLLVAVLGYKTEHYDISSKMVAKILQSNFANARIKDKARELKDELLKKIKTK